MDTSQTVLPSGDIRKQIYWCISAPMSGREVWEVGHMLEVCPAVYNPCPQSPVCTDCLLQSAPRSGRMAATLGGKELGE